MLVAAVGRVGVASGRLRGGTPRPEDPALPERVPVIGVRATGLFAGGRLYRREGAQAMTSSLAWWDPAEVFDHVIELEVDVADASEGREDWGDSLTIAAPCPVHPESPEALPYWRALFWRHALHEADEALRVGQRAPFNPHAEGADMAPVHAVMQIERGPFTAAHTPSDLVRLRSSALVVMREHGFDDLEITCDECRLAAICEHAFDPYNTDGDCLASK